MHRSELPTAIRPNVSIADVSRLLASEVHAIDLAPRTSMGLHPFTPRHRAPFKHPNGRSMTSDQEILQPCGSRSALLSARGNAISSGFAPAYSVASSFHPI